MRRATTDRTDLRALRRHTVDRTKPYLLNAVDNHMGAVTTVTYRSSVVDYVRDDASKQTRWKTPLPFPVLVVGKTERIDQISGGKLTTEYSYHHGYWDGRDREFRGFGRVDSRDTEVLEDYNAGTGFETVPVEFFSPPRETRTWFHVGPVGDPWKSWEELDLSDEYWAGDPKMLDGVRPALPTDYVDRRQAIRTLRGSILRTELYALDGSSVAAKPYTVTEAMLKTKWSWESSLRPLYLRTHGCRTPTSWFSSARPVRDCCGVRRPV